MSSLEIFQKLNFETSFSFQSITAYQYRQGKQLTGLLLIALFCLPKAEESTCKRTGRRIQNTKQETKLTCIFCSTNQCPIRAFTESCSCPLDKHIIKTQHSYCSHTCTHTFTGCTSPSMRSQYPSSTIEKGHCLVEELRVDYQIRVRSSVLKNTKVHCYISINLHHLSQGALRAYGRAPIQQIIKQTILSFLRCKCGGPHREARTSNCTHGHSQPRYGQGQPLCSHRVEALHHRSSTNTCHPKLS